MDTKRFIFAEAKALKENEELGGFEAIANSGKKDRMGDVVDAQGWELGNFKKNPVMLWSHNPSNPPVARADKVWVDDKGLQVKGTWAPTPFAQELRTLFENGFLNALSVGFIPLEMSPNKENGFNITKQELYEISWVGIPADPRALATSRKALEFAKAKGLNLISKELEGEIADQEGEKEPEAEKPEGEAEKVGEEAVQVGAEAGEEAKEDKEPEKPAEAVETPVEAPAEPAEPEAEGEKALERRVEALEKQLSDIIGVIPNIAKGKVAENDNIKADQKANRLCILRTLVKVLNKEIVKIKQEIK